MLKRFASYYKPYWGLLTLDVVCSLLISVADLVYPMVTRDMINSVIPNKELALVAKFGLILAAIYLARAVLEYIVGYYGHVLGIKMERDMRKEIFSHIQTLSFGYFDEIKTGKLMSRVVNDLFDVSEVAHHGPENLFVSTIKIIGAFILLLTINVKLTLIVFTIVPIMFFFMLVFNNRLERIWQKVKEGLAEINGQVEDSISGIRVVKSFTNEEYEQAKFNRGNQEYKELRRSMLNDIGMFDAGINLLSNLSMVITLVAGGYYVALGQISVGDLVAYIMYISHFLQPLNILLRFIELYQQGMAGFKRFIEIMDTKPDINDKAGARVMPKAIGEVEFCDVQFSYNNKETVLSNVNLRVKPGETVALVGPSGSGKTTLCSLLPRFYEVDKGSIKIDGNDVRDVTQASLRRNIGIVQQDVFLFAGTIKENIAYGKPEASMEEIISAAKAANAHEFIMQFPEGYDAYIGERGVKLSGGQKQRISIARMFLKNPPILILDEATSSLDNASELIIQQSIEELAKNRTTFIIAHRLATIRNADRILVLTEKGIEEDGSHQELLNLRGIYYALYNSQMDTLLVG